MARLCMAWMRFHLLFEEGAIYKRRQCSLQPDTSTHHLGPVSFIAWQRVYTLEIVGLIA